MATKCSKCHFDNPFDSKYYEEDVTQEILSEAIYAPATTRETHAEKLTTGLIFAGRYQIIEESRKFYI